MNKSDPRKPAQRPILGASPYSRASGGVGRRASVAAVLCLVLLGSSCNGEFSDADFSALTPGEREVGERIVHWVKKAQALARDPDTPPHLRRKLNERIAAVKRELTDYVELRKQGQARSVAMAPIMTSAGALLADDVTGVGVGDNVLLIPLALAAMATHVITDPAASRQELGLAWNACLRELGALSWTVKDTLSFASRGRVADTGIMAEVHEMIRTMGWRGGKEDICRALAVLLEQAGGDKKRKRRIETTQKAHDCRRHRSIR